jgi:hypothetical protein
MRLSINISSLEALQRGLQQAPQYTQNLLESTMHRATLLVQRETQENIPRGATGLTAASVHRDVHVTPAGVLGVVGSAAPVALFVEMGTKPHWMGKKVREEAIEPWVKAKLGITEPKEKKNVAYLIARKIARKGTKAQKPFERAVTASEAQIVRMFEQAAEQVADHLDGGTA